jgi:hypothetical protein
MFPQSAISPIVGDWGGILTKAKKKSRFFYHNMMSYMALITCFDTITHPEQKSRTLEGKSRTPILNVCFLTYFDITTYL